MTTSLQTSPYLPRQRNFPNDNAQLLGATLDKAYIEIAQKVNERTIGVFAINFPVITGEQWYFQGQPAKQQTLRQVYSFGEIVPGTELDIPTGILNLTQFTKIYGTVITTNGTSGLPDYRPLPYVDPNTLTTSMTILVGQLGIPLVQKIRIVLGPTAPPVSSGIAILEWITNTDTNT